MGGGSNSGRGFHMKALRILCCNMLNIRWIMILRINDKVAPPFLELNAQADALLAGGLF